MSKLPVTDYGAKFRFFVGHKLNDEIGRLRLSIDQTLSESTELSKDQIWVKALARFVTRVPHYLNACELYADPHQEIQLAQLKRRSPTLKVATHANWATNTSLGPEENISSGRRGLRLWLSG